MFDDFDLTITCEEYYESNTHSTGTDCDGIEWE